MERKSDRDVVHIILSIASRRVTSWERPSLYLTECENVTARHGKTDWLCAQSRANRALVQEGAEPMSRLVADHALLVDTLRYLLGEFCSGNR